MTGLLNELKHRQATKIQQARHIRELAEAHLREADSTDAEVDELTRAIAALEPATPAGPEVGAEQAGEPEIPEGFTAHDRGECPVDPDTVVETIGTPSTADSVGVPAKHLDWDFVVAYRILQPAPEPASKQDAAPLPQPQTDAGSAQADAQGAAKNAFREVIEYQDELDQSFENGRVAFKTGVSQDANPHLAMSRYNEHWDAGWLSAQGDAVLHEACLELVAEGKEPAAFIAPGDVQPDPSLHPEHDGTGYLEHDHKIGEV